MKAIATVSKLPVARMLPATRPEHAPLPAHKAAAMRQRALFVAAVDECMSSTAWTLNRAAEHIQHLASSPGHSLHNAAIALGKNGQPVGKVQIARWVQASQAGGMTALTDNRQGRKRSEYGWELRAMNLYAKPQKPSFQLVADQLQREGFETATYTRVRGYLRSLPTDLTSHSVGRLGAQKARATARTYVQRDTSVLDVGMVYQGDGHTVDVYVAHPQTGDLWRPELTVWMDVRSRYIVGWWLSESESAHTTLFALSHAMLTHDHVPDMLHIDNGSGYKSKMMNDESSGFYHRWDIDVMFALPYNAKAKGQIERWFGTMERSFGKQWDTYCGHDMSAEVTNKITQAVKKGIYQLPSLEQYRYALEQWIAEYHHTVHSALDGKTPADVWATLKKSPLNTPEAAAFLPSAKRKVNARALIALDNRTYTNRELLHYQGKEVLVEYSVHNDQWIRVLDLDGHWLCDAKLAEKKAYLPASRIEEMQQKRVKNQIKRLEAHADEARKRAGLMIGSDQGRSDLIELETTKKSGAEAPLKYPLQHNEDDEELIIDLTKWQPSHDEENNHF